MIAKRSTIVIKIYSTNTDETETIVATTKQEREQRETVSL